MLFQLYQFLFLDWLLPKKEWTNGKTLYFIVNVLGLNFTTKRGNHFAIGIQINSYRQFRKSTYVSFFYNIFPWSYGNRPKRCFFKFSFHFILFSYFHYFLSSKNESRQNTLLIKTTFKLREELFWLTISTSVCMGAPKRKSPTPAPGGSGVSKSKTPSPGPLWFQHIKSTTP